LHGPEEMQSGRFAYFRQSYCLWELQNKEPAAPP
jgi:hypothetical protein